MRRFRFSLRSLLLAVFFLAVLLSLYSAPLRRLTVRERAVGTVRTSGGTVTFDTSTKNFRVGRWLYPWMGDEGFLPVILTDLTAARLDTETLAAVSVLQDTMVLRVNGKTLPSDAARFLRPLRKLESITVYEPSGAIRALNDLDGVSSISLHGPPADDTVVEAIAENTSIEHLQFIYWNVTASTLTELAGMDNLRELDLIRCTLDLDLQRDVDANPHIRALRLDQSRFTSPTLSGLCQFPNLEILALRDVTVEQLEIAQIVCLSHLRDLDLTGLRLSDQDPQDLREIPSIGRLNLQFTGIADRGLLSLSALANLQEVVLYKTGVTRRGIEEFKAARPDCVVRHDVTGRFETN